MAEVGEGARSLAPDAEQPRDPDGELERGPLLPDADDNAQVPQKLSKKLLTLVLVVLVCLGAVTGYCCCYAKKNLSALLEMRARARESRPHILNAFSEMGQEKITLDDFVAMSMANIAYEKGFPKGATPPPEGEFLDQERQRRRIEQLDLVRAMMVDPHAKRTGALDPREELRLCAVSDPECDPAAAEQRRRGTKFDTKNWFVALEKRTFAGRMTRRYWVAFRGSADTKDWLDDFEVHKVRNPFGGAHKTAADAAAVPTKVLCDALAETASESDGEPHTAAAGTTCPDPDGKTIFYHNGLIRRIVNEDDDLVQVLGWLQKQQRELLSPAIATPRVSFTGHSLGGMMSLATYTLWMRDMRFEDNLEAAAGGDLKLLEYEARRKVTNCFAFAAGPVFYGTPDEGRHMDGQVSFFVHGSDVVPRTARQHLPERPKELIKIIFGEARLAQMMLVAQFKHSNARNQRFVWVRKGNHGQWVAQRMGVGPIPENKEDPNYWTHQSVVLNLEHFVDKTRQAADDHRKKHYVPALEALSLEPIVNRDEDAFLQLDRSQAPELKKNGVQQADIGADGSVALLMEA